MTQAFPPMAERPFRKHAAFSALAWFLKTRNEVHRQAMLVQTAGKFTSVFALVVFVVGVLWTVASLIYLIRLAIPNGTLALMYLWLLLPGIGLALAALGLGLLAIYTVMSIESHRLSAEDAYVRSLLTFREATAAPTEAAEAA